VIKITIIQPGLESLTYEIEGDEAVIGRSGECDVVVRHPYVSKRHVKVMAGLLVVDLASSNGTFIADKRITQPTRLVGKRIRLGKTEEDVTVEISYEDEDRVAPGTDSELALREERRKVKELSAEVKALRTRLQEQPDSERLAELERVNRELRAQLQAIQDGSERPTAIEERLARLEQLMTMTDEPLPDEVTNDTLQMSTTDFKDTEHRRSGDTEIPGLDESNAG